MFASIRYANLIRCWLCENSVEFVVQAGHCCGHSSTGGTAASHGHHRQHLGLLRFLHSLQGILPVLGAYSHVSRLKYDLVFISQVIAVNILVFSHSLPRGFTPPFVYSSFQIASSLTKELCALVFGINTFLGTILKSIIILIFADKRGLALDVRSQVKIFKGNVHKKSNIYKNLQIYGIYNLFCFSSSWCTSSTSRFLPSCTLWAPPSSSSGTTETGPGKEAWPRDSLLNCVRPVRTQRQRLCRDEKGWRPVWISRVLWLDPCGARGSSAVDGEVCSVLSLNHGASEAAPVSLLMSLYQTCLALTGSLPSHVMNQDRQGPLSETVSLFWQSLNVADDIVLLYLLFSLNLQFTIILY